MGKAVGAGARAGGRAGQGIGMAATMRVSSRGARRGYLAPGDATPPPTASTDYLDYRGVASWQEASNLEGCEFPLGALVDLRRRRLRGPIGLPDVALHRHAIVVGPSGSGKTVSLLLPWMYAALAAGWSVVAVDVKGDLREDFLSYKQSLGAGPLGARMIKWDFTKPDKSIAWEWISELHDEARLDAAITAVIGRKSEKSNVDPYFYQRDYRTLRGLLSFARAVAPKVRTAGQLIQMLEDDQRLFGVVSRNPRAPGAADLDAVLKQTGPDYAKVISGVVTALSALNTPGVNAVTAVPPGKRGLDLDTTLNDHCCLIVGAPLRGGQVSATLSSLILNQLAQRLYERFGQNRRPVLLVIDEAAQVADRVDIAQLMEVARSAGVGVVVALQDVAKLRDENDRSSILSNAATFAILPGASPLSVKEFGQRLGQRFERTFGLTAGGPGAGWGSAQAQQSFGTETVPVLREREIMQPPFGSRPGIVHLKAQELGITSKPLLVDFYRET
jgi:type IV secretory pathway TraG/TraD family ATPase VirD4